jgi:D-alanine-D-alanine ligase
LARTIGLTYDLKSDYKFRKGDPPDANAEFDHSETVDIIVCSIESLGYEVKRLGNARQLLERIRDLGVDIVFNITEGRGSRNRESQVPVMLEMFGIPFVGADGLTLGLTLDKLLAKKIFLSENIPTPGFFEARNIYDFNPDGLKFPLFVKPRYEGTSKGLTEKSRVENIDKLKQQVDYILKAYKQPALIEEFICGYEYTVAIVGNDPIEVFPPVLTKIDGREKAGELFYTYQRVLLSDSIEYVFDPPQLNKDLKIKIMELAKRTYEAVECRDFGRVDFRVDEENNPYVLEINPLPSLSVEDVFMTIAKGLGITYSQMLGKILDSAFRRYGVD